MSEIFKELRSIPDEELIRLHDHLAKHVQVATKHYLDELARRDQERATQTMFNLTNEMHRFTKQVRNITVIILLATSLALIASSVNL